MSASTAVLWALTAAYAAVRLLQVFPDSVPVSTLILLHIALPMVFALIHGVTVYGARGMAVFTALCLGVGFAFEEIGVATGFPFGHYYFTDMMGAKIGHVPVLLALAYLGMGYLSWLMARAIAGWKFTAICAAVVMTTWDLALDPIWSTVERGWVWVDGGPYWGVPLLNFGGWALTAFVFYQGFVWFLRGREPERGAVDLWKPAIAFYAVSAFGNCLQVFRLARQTSAADPTGTAWSIASILTVCCAVSVIGMGGYAALAWRSMSAKPGVAE